MHKPARTGGCIIVLCNFLYDFFSKQLVVPYVTSLYSQKRYGQAGIFDIARHSKLGHNGSPSKNLVDYDNLPNIEENHAESKYFCHKNTNSLQNVYRLLLLPVFCFEIPG